MVWITVEYDAVPVFRLIYPVFHYLVHNIIRYQFSFINHLYLGVQGMGIIFQDERNKSPVDKGFAFRGSASKFPWVPFPEPGGPSNTMSIFEILLIPVCWMAQFIRNTFTCIVQKNGRIIYRRGRSVLVKH